MKRENNYREQRIENSEQMMTLDNIKNKNKNKNKINR